MESLLKPRKGFFFSLAVATLSLGSMPQVRAAVQVDDDDHVAKPTYSLPKGDLRLHFYDERPAHTAGARFHTEPRPPHFPFEDIPLLNKNSFVTALSSTYLKSMDADSSDPGVKYCVIPKGTRLQILGGVAFNSNSANAGVKVVGPESILKSCSSVISGGDKSYIHLASIDVPWHVSPMLACYDMRKAKTLTNNLLHSHDWFSGISCARGNDFSTAEMDKVGGLGKCWACVSQNILKIDGFINGATQEDRVKLVQDVTNNGLLGENQIWTDAKLTAERYIKNPKVWKKKLGLLRIDDLKGFTDISQAPEGSVVFWAPRSCSTKTGKVKNFDGTTQNVVKGGTITSPTTGTGGGWNANSGHVEVIVNRRQANGEIRKMVCSDFCHSIEHRKETCGDWKPMAIFVPAKDSCRGG